MEGKPYSSAAVWIASWPATSRVWTWDDLWISWVEMRMDSGRIENPQTPPPVSSYSEAASRLSCPASSRLCLWVGTYQRRWSWERTKHLSIQRMNRQELSDWQSKMQSFRAASAQQEANEAIYQWHGPVGNGRTSICSCLLPALMGGIFYFPNTLLLFLELLLHQMDVNDQIWYMLLAKWRWAKAQ